MNARQRNILNRRWREQRALARGDHYRFTCGDCSSSRVASTT